jgi:uracil-DNA glycosylase
MGVNVWLMSAKYGEAIVGHDQKIEGTLFKMYDKSAKNHGCEECSRYFANKPQDVDPLVNESRPTSFFVVGSDFRSEKNYRVMFVGKTVQDGWGKSGDDPVDNYSGFIDARFGGKKLWNTASRKSPIWECITEVCSNIWENANKDELWRKIAVTNLVKCSNSPSRDNTTQEMKKNCINVAGYLKQEVEIIKPTHLVLFTGLHYDEYIKILKFWNTSFVEKVSERKIIAGEIRQVEVGWWYRQYWENGKVALRFLRTYHPGYLRGKGLLSSFSKEIADWIKHLN